MTRWLKMLAAAALVLGAAAMLFLLREVDRFDPMAYDPDHAYALAADLTSEALMGRGAGEAGNELAVEYVTDYLEDEGIDYELQYFTQLTPQVDPNGTIQVGETAYHLYEDFEFTLEGRGSDLHFDGEILYVETALFVIDPALLEGRLVVMQSNKVSEEVKDYLIENGAIGYLFFTSQEYLNISLDRDVMDRKFMEIESKTGAQLFQGRITGEMAETLMNQARENMYEEYYRPPSEVLVNRGYEQVVGLVKDVAVNVDVDYRLVELPNILITFPGKDASVSNNIFARFDGLGLGSESSGHFPTALEGGTASASLLELATALKDQPAIPDESITLVLVNGSQVSHKGFEHALSLLDRRYTASKNIAIEDIGFTNSRGAQITWDYYNNQAVILGNKLFKDSGVLGASFDYIADPIVVFDSYMPYSRVDSPFVMITGTHVRSAVNKILDSTDDGMENISPESMYNDMKLVIGYLSRDLYHQAALDFVSPTILFGMGGFALIGLVLMLIRTLYVSLPGERLGMVYYSRGFTLLSLLYKYLLPTAVAMLLIGMVLNIPSDFNMVSMGDGTLTNFSLFDVMRGTYFSLVNMVRTFADPSSDIMQKLLVYIRKSLLLIGWGLGLSLTVGILKGVSDAYSKRKGSSIRTLTSIIAYSIPDVLIAMLSLLAVIQLVKVDWVADVIGAERLRTVIMPIFALSVIPSIYISRLIFVTIEEEKEKEYVKFLYYKGIPRRMVYFRQFIFVSLLKVLSSMKSILMVVFSNLILVEFIFSYPGIMFNIITYQNNPYVIIIFALVIGMLFVAITGLSRAILRMVSPRREASA